MASGCTITSKICLVVVGLIYWAAAASLCFIGAWVYSTYSHFDEVTEASLTLVPASIIIGVGVFMFIIGLLGCIAACKENKCLLSVFFSLILLVFLAEVVAGTMGYVYRDEVKGALDNGLEKALNHYNETAEKDQMNYIQKELHCCGIHNASDWLHSETWKHNNTVPKSCCKNDSACSGQINDEIYNEGCLKLLEEKFHLNLVYIAAVAIAFAIIQVQIVLEIPDACGYVSMGIWNFQRHPRSSALSVLASCCVGLGTSATRHWKVHSGMDCVFRIVKYHTRTHKSDLCDTGLILDQEWVFNIQ